MTEFFHMGGYGVFIWSSYGVAALVMVGLVVATLRGLKAREAQLDALEAERADWGVQQATGTDS